MQNWALDSKVYHILIFNSVYMCIEGCVCARVHVCVYVCVRVYTGVHGVQRGLELIQNSWSYRQLSVTPHVWWELG